MEQNCENVILFAIRYNGVTVTNPIKAQFTFIDEK